MHVKCYLRHTLLRCADAGLTISGRSEQTVISVGSGVTEPFILKVFDDVDGVPFNNFLKYRKEVSVLISFLYWKKVEDTITVISTVKMKCTIPTSQNLTSIVS